MRTHPPFEFHCGFCWAGCPCLSHRQTLRARFAGACANPSSSAICLPMARSSPVTIFTAMPEESVSLITCLGTVARWICKEKADRAIACCLCHPCARHPDSAVPSWQRCSLHRRLCTFHPSSLVHRSITTCGAPLVNCEAAISPFNLRLRALAHWVKRSETSLLISAHGFAVGPADDQMIDHIFLSTVLEASAAIRISSSSVWASNRMERPSVSFIFRQRAGFIGAQHIHTGQLLNSLQVRDDGLPSWKASAPQGPW